MPISDIIDAALSGASPDYLRGREAPYTLELMRQKAQRAGLENQSISNALAASLREEGGRAQADAAYPGMLQAGAAQPGSIARSGAMDTGENPEAAGTPAPVTPGRPIARNVHDYTARGVDPSDLGAVQQYRPELAKSLNLEPPAVSQEREQMRGAINGLSIDEPTKAVYQAMAERPGGMEFVKDLMAKRYMTVPPASGVLDTQSGKLTPSPNLESGAQPETMEISGVQWTKVPNAQGLPTWQRAPEADSAVADWIKAHPQEVAGLDPQVARDVARREIDKRKVTTRVEVTQPALSQSALDRAATYVNEKGELPPGLGFGNPRLRAAILDRAAEMAKQTGGDMGLALIQANAKANSAELTKLQTQRGPVLAFAATAEKNLDYALQLSAQVDRTQIPYLNKWLQSGQLNWTGDPKMANFAGAVRTAINEYAKVTSSTSGGGVTSDKARADVEAILSTKQTPEQFMEVVGGLKIEMGNRIKGYDEQIAATQARISRLGPAGAPATPPVAAPGAPGAPTAAPDALRLIQRVNAIAKERFGQPYGNLDEATRRQIFEEVKAQPGG